MSYSSRVVAIIIQSRGGKSVPPAGYALYLVRSYIAKRYISKY